MNALALPDGKLPKCWPTSYLARPELCKCPDPPDPVEKCWTAQDILALSRMRLKKWAIRKRDIVPSPANVPAPGFQFFTPADITHEAMSIVRILCNAHDAVTGKTGATPFADVLDEYLRTFASDAWESARVWKCEWVADAVPWNPDDTMLTVSTRDRWLDTKEPLQKVNPKIRDRLAWLNTGLCALVKGKERNACYQALWNWTVPGELVTVYCELIQNSRHVVKKPDTKAEAKVPESSVDSGTTMADVAEWLLLPWLRAFRDADGRWENHETLTGVFPPVMQDTLLSSSADGGGQAALNPRGRRLQAVSKVERVMDVYSTRVRKEVDAPVNLALATLGDMWGFVFPGVVEPAYADFQRAQQFMRTIPEYRDHLTHSVQVFLLGCKIMQKTFDDAGDPGKLGERYNIFSPRGQRKEVKEERKSFISRLRDRDYGAFMFQWSMASLMHDFAIPASYTNELVTHVFATFLGVKSGTRSGSNGLRDILEQEGKKAHAIIYGVFGKTSAGAKALGPFISPTVDEDVLQKLAEDHGFLSALYLFNQLFEGLGKPGWWRLKRRVERLILMRVLGLTKKQADDEYSKGHDSAYRDTAEALVLEVLDAIIKHNAFAKEHRLGFRREHLGANFRFPSDLSAAESSLFESAIPGLLFLCDTLCDWGRVIHPDGLMRHEPRAGASHEPESVERPENLVTGVQGRRISVDYRWRLPFHYPEGCRECCLFVTFDSLREDMWPYAPAFAIPEVCSDCCKRHKTKDLAKMRKRMAGLKKEQCALYVNVRGFWKEVMRLNSNTCRLKFPAKHSEFNRLTLDIKYCGEDTDFGGALVGP